MLARYPPLLLAHLLVGSLSLTSALTDKCQLPQMPRSWQHSLPGSLLLHKMSQDHGDSCQDPGSRAVSPLFLFLRKKALLKICSLEGSVQILGCRPLDCTKTRGWGDILVVVFAGGPPAHGHLSISPSSCGDMQVWEVMTAAPLPHVS